MTPPVPAAPASSGPPPAPGTGPRPPWLTVRAPAGEASERVASVLSSLSLRTVCDSARCPNRGECSRTGTATVILLGPACTRSCAFCSVAKGDPAPPDPTEPSRAAEAAALLGWRHVVLTSVTRDDLPDGGASHLAAAVSALRDRVPGAAVELLVPDFGGAEEALALVLASSPDVIAHNVETVPRLYPRVRPGASWERSLSLLGRCAAPRGGAVRPTVKSGLMAGLGESREEIRSALSALREAGVVSVAVGQYLPPSRSHLPAERYLAPEEFDAIGEEARALGFRRVLSAPLARSSFRAGEEGP